MSELAYTDFRSFVEEAKKISDFRIIENADWDAEIGALVESTAELVSQPPMLIFDKVKGYPAGFRVCSLPYAAYRRVALALGLPTDKTKFETLRLAARKVRSAEPIPPKEVSTSPLFENKLTGADVDMLKFPALRFHENDGGRYFGPGGGLINRDPDSGYVNTGTYRMQLHDKNTLGLWMSPGQNGRQICAKYWEKGKSCPVVASYGQHPMVFMPSYTKFPYGRSEMEISGGLIGRPLEVLRGPITGSADSRLLGDRHRRRDSAAVGRGARRRTVRRMAGILFRRHHRHRREPTDHSRQGDLSSQRSDPRRRSAALAGSGEDGSAYFRRRAVGPAWRARAFKTSPASTTTRLT